ncbi:MAG TPA: TOPRIM nucleotidyl transferase/hydrolase domain-containing protein [Gaiellaceae bacterium]|nr:TOPRIM nucleotidyl transferase/hydrolase domain-containing protein [Gaiellaceae bacterium]
MSEALVLVEGTSDVIAVETLAALRGRDLAAEGVEVRAIGGAQAIARVLASLPAGTRVAGLCDENEEPVFRRAAERFADLPFEFFVCRADLEDELMRALGVEAVEALFAEHGDLRSFRTFQRQPAWAGRPVRDQLRRFLGSADRRKQRYGRVFLDALEPRRVPQPLVQLLDAV